MPVTWDKIVKKFNQLNAEKSAARKAWETQEAELDAKLEEIKNFMLSALNEGGMESIKTSEGTFYRKSKIIPQGADWDAFYKWVAENDAFDALERRIKATFVSQWMDEHDGVAPPGVNVFRQWQVGVRKS